MDSRLVVGVITTLIGICLIGASFFVSDRIVFLSYGIPIFVVGLVIFLNRKEDVIEQIKWKKK